MGGEEKQKQSIRKELVSMCVVWEGASGVRWMRCGVSPGQTPGQHGHGRGPVEIISNPGAGKSGLLAIRSISA